MDAINIIVTALALGAAAGLRPTVEQAVKDAYAGLKSIILEKYLDISFSGLEKNPDSDTQKQALAECLRDVDADKNEAVLEKAQALLNAIKESSPEIAATIGIELDDVKSASLTIDTIIASGNIDVHARRADIAGDIVIRDLKAGGKPAKK